MCFAESFVIAPRGMDARTFGSRTSAQKTLLSCTPSDGDLDVLNRGPRFAAIRIATGSQSNFKSHDSNRKARTVRIAVKALPFVT